MLLFIWTGLSDREGKNRTLIAFVNNEGPNQSVTAHLHSLMFNKCSFLITKVNETTDWLKQLTDCSLLINFFKMPKQF